MYGRPKIIDVNKNETVFYPLSIKTNKCSGNCNNINDPEAKLCAPDIVKNMNIKVFNMLAKINETKKITWHETCKCVCRFTKAVCNDKQEWDENECKRECIEDLIDKLKCDKGYMCNPSTCTCECNKYCEVGQYLDYENCVCKKKLIEYLVKQCTSIADIDSYKKESSETNVYFISFIIFLILSVLLVAGLIYYFRKYNKRKIVNNMYNIVYSCEDMY